MDTMRDTSNVTPEQKYIQVNIQDIPPGKNRLVEGWSLDNTNIIMHYGAATIGELFPNENKSVGIDLYPKYGTIQIPIANIPNYVDSIFASFTSNTDTITKKIIANTGNEIITLEDIPDKMQGILYIFATDTLGDTIFTASKELTFDATKNITIHIQFKPNSSSLEMTIYIHEPGITIIITDMGTTDTLKDESGPLIISEIMYYGYGDSDYIELYNTTDDSLFYDYLYVKIIGGTSGTNTLSKVNNISIKANGFFVIGNGKTPTQPPDNWADTNVNMKLSSSDKWIVIQQDESTIFDWVAYYGGTCDWPSKKSKYAVVLDSLNADPQYNNYGKHWKTATSQISASDHYGTPGKAGM